MQWFRMYAEAVDDDKLRLLAFEDRWHFVAVLCLKAAGILDERDETFRKRRIGIKLGLDSAELETAMKRLVTVGLLTERWQPINWAKRQFRSDSSTSRVRSFRKRSRNVSETHQIQRQIQNREEKNKRAAAPPGLDAVAWEKWEEYRRRRRPAIRPESIEAAQRKLAAFGEEQMAVVENSIANGYQGLIAPNRNGSTQQDTGWRPTA